MLDNFLRADYVHRAVLQRQEQRIGQDTRHASLRTSSSSRRHQIEADSQLELALRETQESSRSTTDVQGPSRAWKVMSENLDILLGYLGMLSYRFKVASFHSCAII